MFWQSRGFAVQHAIPMKTCGFLCTGACSLGSIFQHTSTHHPELARTCLSLPADSDDALCQRRFTSTWFWKAHSDYTGWPAKRGTASVWGELNVKGSTIRNTLSIKCSTEHRIIVSITQEDFPFRNCMLLQVLESALSCKENPSILDFPSACRISSLFFPIYIILTWKYEIQ